MSTRPQPTQKQMILQQLMLAVAVFLGAQMMCNRPQGPVDTRKSQDILGNVSNPATGAPPTPAMNESWDLTKGTLAWADSTLNWSTLGQIKSIYEKKLDDETSAQKKGVKDPAVLAQVDEQEKAAKLYGDILQADAQYKYAIAHQDTNAMRNAFNTISSDQRSLQGTTLWTQEFPVPQAASRPERFPWQQWSGKGIYDDLVSALSAKNQSDLIYGVFPGYQIIDSLVKLTGSQPGFSYAFAAFLLALIVRIIVFPLVQKQLMWGRKMQQLGPLVKEIREQFTDKKTKQVTDPAELQKRTMALYQEYGINPLAGCLPAAVQFPLFITVYQFMLRYQFAFRKGTFLWVNPAASAATHGFLAPTLGDRDYILIIIYGITMVISTLLMPVSDPTQVKQQKLMGVGMGLLFTVMMFTGAFPTPAAFVLYWVFTNLLATAQSLRAYRMPLPPLEKVNTKSGGVFPMPPFNDGGSMGNGRGNGKPITPLVTPKSTGTPAKHKPKKRK